MPTIFGRLFALAAASSVVFLACTVASAQRFITPPSYFNGTEAYSVVEADFNGDGKLDLAVLDDGSLWMLLGKGDGNFQTPIRIAALSGSLAFADFNRDGKLDLATADYSNGTVSTLLGNGDGTFQAPRSFSAGPDPISIVAGDFAGNGEPGVAVINAQAVYQQNETVSVLLGNGDGTLQPPIATPVDITLYTMAGGDFNKDGKQDLVVSSTDFYNSPFDYVLTSIGNGSFGIGQLYPPGQNYPTFAFAVGDLNGDGNLDVVTAMDYGLIDVFLGNGSGGFRGQQPFTGYAGYLAIGDVNGDGKPDLVSSGYAETFVLLGNGNGTFQYSSNFNSGYGATSVVAGDLNGDNKADVVVGTFDDLAVLLNQGDGALQAPLNYGSILPGGVLTLDDFNGDGFLDVEAGGPDQDYFQMFLGEGNGSLQPPLVGQVGGVTAGDFNNDGILDESYQQGLGQGTGVCIAFGQDNGTFSSSDPCSSLGGIYPGNMVSADLNRDGKLDLAVAAFENYSGNLVVLLGNGDGTFQTSSIYPTDQGSIWLVAGDFNGDGFPDLAVTNANGDDVSVLLNKGNGTFLPAVNYAVGGSPSRIVAGDFNEDGKLDLAVCNLGSTFTLLLGNGDGTFRPDSPSTRSCFQTLIATDFNGDGHLDLLVDNDPNYTIWYGKGDGTFPTSLTVNLASYPSAMAVGDMNGDGAPDLVWEGSSLAILLNTGGTWVTTTSSMNPSKYGQPVTLSTQVVASVPGTKAIPTGTVTFKYKSRVLGKAKLVGGVASLTDPKPPVGSFEITPVYSGDANFNPHTGAPLLQRVER